MSQFLNPNSNKDAAGAASRVSLLLRFTLLLLLLAPAPAAALDPERHISQYGHTAWKVFDGAIPGFNTITQTTDGYIWLGTKDGLMRYDGVRFSLWKSAADEPLMAVFTAMLGASDGSLWIGTLDGLMHLKNGKLYTYKDEHAKAHIRVILQDRDGTIWVVRNQIPKGSDPLCRVGEVELVCYGAKEGLSARFALGLTRDSDGYFWIGGDALCRWRPGSAATCFNELGRQDGTAKPVSALASGPSGSVWAALDAVGPQFGVRYFSGGRWSPLIVPGFDGPSIRSHALYLDRHDSLWVGTENNGLYRIHDGVADHYGSTDGLSSNGVGDFYEDREGNLWVSTDSGLDMFRDTAVISYSMAQGLFASTIASVLARRDGSIWIGNQGAIDILRNGEHSLLSLRGLPGETVGPLFEDHAQTVWLGLDLALLAYRDQRFFEIMRPDASPLRQNQPLAMTEDTDGNIWVRDSSNHLFCIKDQKVAEDIQLDQSLSSAAFLESDSHGGIWVGAKGKIARYHAGQFETYSLEDDVGPVLIREMIADGDNSLLISTGRGLVRWSNGQTTKLGVRNGLPCESIYSTIKDDNGSLWLYAKCALLEIEASQVAKWEGSPGSQISVKLFDAYDGAFPGRQIQHQRISSKAPDGRLWFTNGIMAQVVDPKHLARNEVPPPVSIEDVIADRKPLGTQAGMQVPALTRDLRIDYTALSFSVPQKVRFRYILEGHDTAWQEPGGRRQAFYTDLRPGKYRFRVIACNNDGVWNESGANLSFSVTPAWYQTNSFRVACVLGGLLLLWALHKLRMRQAARALSLRFDERLSERTRIAREFHDTLIQTIQGSKLVADDALDRSADPARMRHALEQLSEWLNRAIQEGRAALHSLRTSATETNDLAEGLRRATEECRMFGPIVASFSVDGNAREMHPVVRDEIYRIGYEAIRNACAHSKASSLHVGLKYGHDIAISIGDNGVGIPESIINGGTNGHYGLQGMRERATRIGGKLRIVSSVDSGTEVSLVIPGRIAFRGTGNIESE